MNYNQIALSKKLIIGVNDDDFRKKYGEVAYQRVKTIMATEELAKQGLLSPNPKPNSILKFITKINKSVKKYFGFDKSNLDLSKEHVERIRKLEMTKVKEIPGITHPEQESKVVGKYND